MFPHHATTTDERRPSVELSRFSTLFQQWDIAASSASDDSSSSTSRRGSQQFDGDALFGPDFTSERGSTERQRTMQACDKCRDRKTKCSGDHPVCKRCTARGLICHYSERDRIRGPAKARLRNAMSSSALDLRFTDGAEMPVYVKQEADHTHSSLYAQPQPLGHVLPSQFNPNAQYAMPVQMPMSVNTLQPSYIPIRARPTLSRASLPQVMHPEHDQLPQFHHRSGQPLHQEQEQQLDQHVRRVQSHSALGGVHMHRPPTLNLNTTLHGYAHRPPPRVVEFDMRDGPHSESRSAPASVMHFEKANTNMSHSAESSGSAAPRSPIATSELNLGLLAAQQQQRHVRWTLPPHSAKPRYLSGAGEPHVPQVNGMFGNPWAETDNSSSTHIPSPTTVVGTNPWGEDSLTPSVRQVRADVELVYPSPVTPIGTGGSDLIWGVRGHYSKPAQAEDSEVSPLEKASSASV
ncbi:hypothetical protein C8F01DRAFT_6552 [Mycena amicta]|nr:hypothetical protein C8F01DRAFT_6552 [Mycena amicta]